MREFQCARSWNPIEAKGQNKAAFLIVSSSLSPPPIWMDFTTHTNIPPTIFPQRGHVRARHNRSWLHSYLMVVWMNAAILVQRQDISAQITFFTLREEFLCSVFAAHTIKKKKSGVDPYYDSEPKGYKNQISLQTIFSWLLKNLISFFSLALPIVRCF